MKAQAQEKMGPPKPAHDMSASSESESEGDSESSSSSTSSDESVSSSSSSEDDNENKSQDHAGGDASKNGDSKGSEVESDNDDSDSSSSDSDSSDNDSTSGESGPESSQVDSKILPVSKAEESKLAFSSPNKTETLQQKIKQEEEEIDDMPGSTEFTPSKTRLSIIEGIVKDPAEFTVVDAPGPYTVEDINSKNDYYIFRFPVGMLNPVQLAETKVSIRNQKSSVIQVNNRPFEVRAYDYEPGAETPTLFLPDKSGQLNQVDLLIKSQVVLRLPTPRLNTANVVQFNIDDLRSRVHLPPEIKERNFFASIGSRKSTIKKEKLSKEEKKLLKEKGKHSKKAKKEKEKEKLSEEAKRLKKKEKKLAKERTKKRSLDLPSSSPKKIKIET